MKDLSQEDAEGRRPTHGGANICLHCMLWETLNSYHDKAGLKEADGQLRYNMELVLGNFGDVLAEFIAALPEAHQRKRALKALDHHMRIKIAAYRETGNHPVIKAQRLQ
jgi:hypothetical protein